MARRNAPTPVSRPNSLAVVPEEINLSEHYWRVSPGQNVLAIQGLNDAPDGADFLISAELVEYRETLLTINFFSTPSPGRFNSTGFLARVADTQFSHDRGFYDGPFAAVSNNTYGVMYADAVNSNDWYPLAYFNAAPSNRTILHTNFPAGQRYYRLWTTKTPEP